MILNEEGICKDKYMQLNSIELSYYHESEEEVLLSDGIKFEYKSHSN